MSYLIVKRRRAIVRVTRPVGHLQRRQFNASESVPSNPLYAEPLSAQIGMTAVAAAST